MKYSHKKAQTEKLKAEEFIAKTRERLKQNDLTDNGQSDTLTEGGTND